MSYIAPVLLRGSVLYRSCVIEGQCPTSCVIEGQCPI